MMTQCLTRYFITLDSEFLAFQRKNMKPKVTVPHERKSVPPVVEDVRSYITRAENELSSLHAEICRVENDCSWLERIIDSISKPDGSVNPSSLSELIERENERCNRVEAELEKVQEVDRLIVSACCDMKEEIRAQQLRSDFLKLRTFARFEHPSGELFFPSR